MIVTGDSSENIITPAGEPSAIRNDFATRSCVSDVDPFFQNSLYAPFTSAQLLFQ
jgi:hypothetical protein